MENYYAHGKLLITGEYLVLKGAKALAVPLNKGQSLTVEKSNQESIFWKATTPLGVWLEVQFDNKLNILSTNDKKKAENLKLLFQQSIELNRLAETKINNTVATTHLEFLPQWGWGSSSTLVHLLSQWLDVNPYRLLQSTFGGSGYDIACANSDKAILYQRNDSINPKVTPVYFNPSFAQQMGVVYLNKKQSSSTQVKQFLKTATFDDNLIDKISKLTDLFVETQDIDKFMQLMKEHEELIAQATQLQPVQNELFLNFDGAIKSLGAWGGDFVLFVSHHPFLHSKEWFATKGYHTVFSFEEVVLKY